MISRHNYTQILKSECLKSQAPKSVFGQLIHGFIFRTVTLPATPVEVMNASTFANQGSNLVP